MKPEDTKLHQQLSVLWYVIALAAFLLILGPLVLAFIVPLLLFALVGLGFWLISRPEVDLKHDMKEVSNESQTDIGP